MEKQFLSGNFVLAFFNGFLEKRLLTRAKIALGNVTFFFNDNGDLGWDTSISKWNEKTMSRDMVEMLSSENS